MKIGAKIMYNSLVQVASKVVGTALGLVAVAIFTRYLGDSGFGRYTTATAFASIFAIIADLGLTLVSSQLINRPNQNQNKLLSNLFAFRIVSAVVIIGMAPVAVSFMPYDAGIKVGVWLAALGFLFVALNQVFVSLFQKELKTDRIAVAEVASRALLALGAWLVVIFDAGLFGILWSMAIANLLGFALHYWFSRSFAKVGLAFDWIIWREILSKSWPLLTTIVLNLIYLKADIIILSLFKGSREVGLYGAAYKVVDVLVSLPFVFAGLVLPLLVNYWTNKQHNDFKRVWQKFFDYTIILAIPLAAGGAILATPIMKLVAGPQFVESGPILRILMLAVAAVFVSCFFTHIMISWERQKKLIPYYLFTALTAVPIYYFLISRYSYFGAAWATVYSEVVIAIGSAWLMYRESGWPLRMRVVLRVGMATSLMSAALLGLMPLARYNDGWLLFTIIVGMAVYFSALVALGGIDRNDLPSLLGKRLGGPTVNNL